MREGDWICSDWAETIDGSLLRPSRAEAAGGSLQTTLWFISIKEKPSNLGVTDAARASRDSSLLWGLENGSAATFV